MTVFFIIINMLLDLSQGVLAMEGIYDANEKPVIMCSLDDHSVQMFELPS